ncbi:MAG: 4Fe-4S dicluster domain-containing protein [Planctomycetota bacterium]|jgi:electron transport complex protein RnfC
MLLRRHGSFEGGIEVPDEKRETIGAAIHPASLPERLRVPLAMTATTPARPVVAAGQRVAAYQPLTAVGGDVELPIFSPVAGRVASTDAVADIPTGRGFRAVAAVELTDLEAPQPAKPTDAEPPLSAEPKHLQRQIAQGHLTTFRRPPQPLRRWMELATTRPCQLLVANVMENQPYLTADHRLLVEHGEDVLWGLATLGRAIGAGQIALAVDLRRTGSYRHLITPADRYGVQRIALPHKYPIGIDVILLKTLTGVETPQGRQPFDIGAAVIDAATCLAVCRWLRDGQRTTMRTVTVAGEQVVHSGNFLAPFGMLCRDLARVTSRSLIHGGPMVGLQCTPHAVVTPATDAVLAVGLADMAPPSPCIRCGWCSDHCPARLNVAALNDAFELVQVAHAHRAGAEACVRCGICSYVCPARLPLTERVEQLKAALAGRPMHPIAP